MTTLFREYGYRRSRNHARLKFLVKTGAPRRSVQVLEEEFLVVAAPGRPRGHRVAACDPEPRRRAAAARRSVLRRLRDARGADQRAPAAAGRRPRGPLRVGAVALTAQQQVVVTGVAPERSDALVADLEALDLLVKPSAFRKGTMACTGIEFCKLAIGETKGRAQWLTSELERRLPDFGEEIRIHVNGCPNSCARFQVADIGLMAALRVRPDGTKSDAFLVHLGGTMGGADGAGAGAEGAAESVAGSALGRKVKGVKIYAEDAADYLELLLTRYRHRRAESDTFASYIASLDAEGLARFAAPKEPTGALR